MGHASFVGLVRDAPMSDIVVPRKREPSVVRGTPRPAFAETTRVWRRPPAISVILSRCITRALPLLIKAQLVTKIAEIIRQKGITQTQAAQLLGMSQPKLSNLLRGQFRGISERRLMDCLTKLGRDVQIVVKAAPRSRASGRLSIVFA